MKVFSAQYLDNLTQQAVSSPRIRQHRNVHQSYTDQVQRLFNAIEPDSYIRPHRHALVPRDELLVAIRGLMSLVTFDDQGQIEQVLRLGSEKYGAEIAAGVEIPSDTWHTLIALEPGSVLLEIKAGPFDPDQPKDLAPWAPEEHSVQAAAYLRQLHERVQEA